MSEDDLKVFEMNSPTFEKQKYQVFVSKHWYRKAKHAANNNHPDFKFIDSKLHFKGFEIKLL